MSSLPVAAVSVDQIARGDIASTTSQCADFSCTQGVDRALGYLRSRCAADETTFPHKAGVGVAALVTLATMRHGCSAQEPLAIRSLEFIVNCAQPEGSVHSPGGALANYETCLALTCLAEAAIDGTYAPLMSAAEAFLRRRQWVETGGKEPSDIAYGGAGYGKHQRPDLSNTAFFVDALIDCGCEPNDPAIQKALVFASRCQNLISKHNTTAFAAQNPDGGFYYTCAAGGGSPAGASETGGLLSYGSMTLNGLRIMIHAGLTHDDQRVSAAIAWLKNHFDVTSHPGLGDAGLFYYYVSLARTMQALGCWSFEDAAGVSHDWRSELRTQLLRRQRDDGSWANENPRWMEGDPILATAYALLALDYCQLVPGGNLRRVLAT